MRDGLLEPYLLWTRRIYEAGEEEEGGKKCSEAGGL